MEHCPTNQKVAGSIPSRVVHRRQPINVSVSLSLSPLPPPLRLIKMHGMGGGAEAAASSESTSDLPVSLQIKGKSDTCTPGSCWDSGPCQGRMSAAYLGACHLEAQHVGTPRGVADGKGWRGLRPPDSCGVRDTQSHAAWRQEPGASDSPGSSCGKS